MRAYPSCVIDFYANYSTKTAFLEEALSSACREHCQHFVCSLACAIVLIDVKQRCG